MVVLVARPSTKEIFVISAIENGAVYLAKQYHPGFLCMQPIGLFLLYPWMGSWSIAELLSQHCILHTLGWREAL